jgi:uncharacterized protein (DUF2235 family)
MPRKIALFSDGTGNSSAKAEKTNVWRLFEALDQTRTDQIAKYDDGVGTSTNKYLAALGGAFGWGLKRNVLDLYRFVCRNYSPGDDIYGFGFSRGAFTIRVLVGLIAREGVVTFRSEEELIRNSAAAYRQYRSKSFPSRSPIVWGCRRLRNAALWIKDRIKGYRSYAQIEADTEAAGRKVVPIRLLGLWDTVEAYGLPIEELKRGIDWVLWPMLFGDLILSARVKRACHALSLDDERTTFHPLIWDEVAEARMVEEGKVPAGRITQVWFAGVHSNVGGGYPEDQLSYVTLDWMMGEAAANGLVLDASDVQQVACAKSPYAKLYDSRKGLSAYYRYSPRRIAVPKDQDGNLILPIIHGSVLMRMIHGSDAYAPITLPHEFWILAPNGQLLPMAGTPASLRIDKSKRVIAGDATSRPAAVVEKERAELDDAIARLSRPDRQAVRLVWDTVFWRRCLFALTVSLTVLLLAYPLISDNISNGAKHIPLFGQIASASVDEANQWARGPLADLVGALSGLIPKYAQPWKQALNDYPLEFCLLVISIIVSLGGSSVLERRIHDRARLAWHQGVVQDYTQWRQESRNGFRNLVLVALGLAAVALVASILRGKTEATSLVYALPVIALTGVLALRGVGHKETRGARDTRIRSTFALLLARNLRDNSILRGIYSFVVQRAIPIAFAILLVACGGVIVNRVTFAAMNSAGYFCHGTDGLPTEKEKTGTAATQFYTSDMCWASGLVLEKGHRYLITVTAPGDWFDRTIPTDVNGFPTDSFRHASATTLKRFWKENWLKPVARIGQVSNDEYVLNSIDDIDPPLRVLRSEVKARTTGELFLYVNDAVLGVPGLADLFVRNNSGSATVSVERITRRVPE